MTVELCTLFDARYLPRGLALYRSLARTGAEFRLRCVCMDDATARVLERLALPGLEPIRLAELERHDAGLAAAKTDRTAVEYCWTATPAVCLYCLEREPALPSITYLDADLAFSADPRPVFEEMGDASVLITPHRFAPRWEFQAAASGIYNVQFMTFRRTPEGLEALRWWRERCLEWCYARVEDGKFGDQKYLDDWPSRFAGVHVLAHPGAGLAPWNVERYRLERRRDSVLVDGRELIFYHHHGLRLLRPPFPATPLPPPYRRAQARPPLAWTTLYPVSRLERRLIWAPYVRRLAEALAEIRRADPSLDGGVAALPVRALARAGVRAAVPRRVLR